MTTITRTEHQRLADIGRTYLELAAAARAVTDAEAKSPGALALRVLRRARDDLAAQLSALAQQEAPK